MSKTLCVTGHRPPQLGGYEPNPLQDWVRNELAKAFYSMYLIGLYDHFICGGALGVDWWAEEEVIDLRKNYPEVTLTLALPFDGYNNRWPEQTYDYFKRHILKQANRVLYVSKEGYNPYKMQVRNEWMVDNAELVVAVFNGSAGGTFNCVEYARKQGKLIYRINPLTKEAGYE